MVMQNSSNSQKPKSSKYSRAEDLEDSKEQADESLENFGGGSNLKGIPTIVICQRDNRQRGRSSRGRDDGRPPFRGSERRGGRGSRGGPFRSRNERDGESSYSPRNKFQESMTRGSSYKHSNDSDVFKNRDGVSLLPEDCRISKLLRRLCQEDDLDKFFAISKQLKEALLLPDNGRYIRRSLDYIVDSLLDVLTSGPSSDARLEGAKCIGVAGIALEQDAKRLIEWVFNTYQRECNDVRVLLMQALEHMLELDDEHQKLNESINYLMSQLQLALENTDKPEILQAVGNTILALKKFHPETFVKFFRDTVDILIGWHIDMSQPASVTQYASHTLQQLGVCWVSDLSFSLNLLSQFLEDMEAYSEDLVHPLSGRSTPDEEPPPSAEVCLLRITSIIQVFTTVTLSLGPDLAPREGSLVTTSFLMESLERVLTTALIALEHEEFKESVLVAGNDCACLLLGVLGSRGSGDNLYKFIKLQLDILPDLASVTINSSLKLIAKTVRECSANLPEWLVHELLGSESPILPLRFSVLKSLQNSTLDVYHSLLSLKNIPLLQETYRYVLQDLGRAYSLLVPGMEMCLAITTDPDAQFEPYKEENAETAVLFLLNALSDIARASNSIIGMWALKPTIMELLAVTLLPEDTTLTMLKPTVQYSLTYLLYSHCSRYSNFVSSTGLVVSGRSSRSQLPGLTATLEMSASSSPTSGHLTLILKLITNMLSKPGVWLEVQMLGLRWATELIAEAKTSLPGLMATSSFGAMVNAVVKSGSTDIVKIIKGVANCLETLLSHLHNYTHQPILVQEMVRLCMVQLNSSDAGIREMYHYLLLLLPWHQVLQELVTITENTTIRSTVDRSFIPRHPRVFNLDLVCKVNKIHCVRSDCGEMTTQHFRKFMAFLLQGTQLRDNDWLAEMLSSCLPPVFADMEDDTSWLRLAASGSQAAQFVWAAWQAAQFCVTFKLRTPLGKPQETFTSIEGAIKNLARALNNETVMSAQKNSTSKPPAPTAELLRARLLLLFLEHLEKAIYNAAEGCAIAMPTQAKPVRLFFHTNKAVCGEWTSRIRWATMLVATHCSMPSMVLRHGSSLLQDHLDQANMQSAEFEKATVMVCSALVMMRESEALQGVYVWCKEKAGRRFPWIKVAALQAAARYEEAVVEYSKLMPADSSDSRDSLVMAFISDQMSDCLRMLGDWSRLVQWKKDHPDLSDPQVTVSLATVSSALSLKHVQALSDFNQLTKPADTSSSYAGEEIIVAATGGVWRPSKMLASIEEQLASVGLCLANKKQISSDEKGNLLEICCVSLRTLEKLMEESVRGGPISLTSEIHVLQHVAQAFANRIAAHESPNVQCRNPFLLKGVDISHGSAVLNRVLWWSKLVQHVDQSPYKAAPLLLVASRSARKEGNASLAEHLLLSYWREKMGEQVPADKNILSSLDPLKWVKQGAGLALKETAKLLYSQEKSMEATNLLARSALVSAQEVEAGVSSNQEVASSLLLSLAKKLNMQLELPALIQGLNISSTSNNNETPLAQLLHWSSAVADTRMLAEWDVKVPDAVDDTCTQQLLQLSLISCPRNAKAWSHFASWSYKRGRRVSESEEEGGGAPLVISDMERIKVSEILGPENSLELCEAILVVMQEFSQSKSSADDTQELSDKLQSLLPSDLDDNEEKIKQLMALWGQRSQSHYYYHASAIAYFKFLQLCEGQDNDKEESLFAESILTATLRLLRLIVKHATPLQDVLESGLSLTPTTPWKGIIPQLFARLSHPESYVRRRLSELLCRLAADAPHLILFPAVVGCSSHKSPQKNDNLFDSCIQEGDEEEDDDVDEDEDSTTADESQTSVLRSCFLAMVDTLSQQAPASTSQVRLLVSELRRITVLWDELWLGCLIQHHPDVNRKLAQLDTELKRLDENESLDDALRQDLAREKYRIIMKPIVMIFEQLQTMTSVPPETPHEKLFQEKFSDIITEAINMLKNPPTDKPIKPQSCWLLFRQLQAKLHSRAQRRATQTFKLSEISPALANLKDSAIAMPGLSQSQPLVTIAALENIVSVLPTKTRPKKLVLTGSDGKHYTYLFKGLEDLHLDERIMQFLSIANTMMAHNKGAKFQARHYSVVPLGARSGLISWVDGVQPMFGLYKRWQLREANANQLRNQTTTTAPTTVPRPSELFYNKLAPLLTERGIAVESRKEWPQQVLKQVLSALISETPKDLLAKELWCMSANAADWWNVTSTYARSVAVMSVIGYIIGLGDRHLDNLLINLATGEVVHIDYNVCFEKGQTLRVPEKVPFRMTPNLQTALGVTGCEGIFRVSCEHVLRVLKRGRETLLTLLEAFVYDPLIDWTPGSEAGYTGAAYGGQSQRGVSEPPRPSRRELEREAAHAMLAVRVTEMQSAWLANRDELVSARLQVVESLNNWIASVGGLHDHQEELQEALQQMALLKEAAACGASHPLFSLHVRHSARQRAKDAQSQTLAALREAHEQAHQNNIRLQAALNAVRGPELPGWAAELGQSMPYDDGGREMFDLVREFLISAGQSPVMAQCEQSERECARLGTQLQLCLRAVLELLGQYSVVVALFPSQHLECMHNIQQERLADELLNNLSSDRCRIAIAQMQSLSMEPSLAVREQAAQYHTQLQLATNHANTRLQAAFKRLSIEGPEDPTQRLEAALAQAHSQIAAFSSEPSSATVFTVAALQHLCDLDGNFLALEAAAASTGESLVDLTLREGDWFLDKLLQMSGVAAELGDILIPITSTITAATNGQLTPALYCLQTVHAVYKGLEDLLWSVNSIILPEAVAAFTTHQPSVLSVVRSVADLVASAQRPLPDICKEIEVNLRYLALDLALPHPGAQTVCAGLRDGLKKLLNQADEGQAPLSPGQMLLMGFNGLFDRLQHDASKLTLALSVLRAAPSWSRLDHLQKARSLNWSIIKESSQPVIEDLFLLRRLQVMHEFFSLCDRMALGFSGRSSSEVVGYVSEEALVQPIRRFTADFVQHQLIGLQPQAITVAICVIMEETLSVNLAELIEQRGVGVEGRVSMEEICRTVGARLGADARLGQAGALLGQLETSWRLREGAVLAQREAEAARASTQRLQLQAAAHAWINDFPQCGRAVFIAELRKNLSTLMSVQPCLIELSEEQKTLVGSITHRLKWAAGANPTLSEVLVAFNRASECRQKRMQSLQMLCSKLVNTCTAILHMETLRNSTAEATVHNAAFIQLLSQCEQSAALTDAAGNLVMSSAEESLALLLLPEQLVDMTWIISAENIVSGRVKQLGMVLASHQCDQTAGLEKVRAAVSELRSVITRHHSLVAGVRALLRTLAKPGEGQEALSEYLTRYRSFSEQFSSVVRSLGAEELEPGQAELITPQLAALEHFINPIYEDLLALPSKSASVEEKTVVVGRARPPLLRQESVCMSPQHGVPAISKPTSLREKVPQEKNAYALSVWRRVRAKLEGRDPDPSKKATVPEQVDFIINEATSLDNLCLLYEGWTPWV